MKKTEDEIINHFFTERKKALENPLIRGFLKDEKNYRLVEKAILYPTKHNKQKVENAFKSHYENVVTIKYITNLIHFYSIDFDKRIRKQRDYFTLILDQELTNEKEATLKDIIESKFKIDDNLFNTSLFDITDNNELIKGLKTLTQNQLSILELIYLKELKLWEIAEILNTTPQNISNQHRKSLKKLYNYMNREGRDEFV